LLHVSYDASDSCALSISTYLHSGNQARVADKSTVVSTSTRNFPNRLGKGANVFLASAELASISAIEGKLPTVAEYQKYAAKINETKNDTFRYLNFDRLSEYVSKGNTAEMGADVSHSVRQSLHLSYRSLHLTLFRITWYLSSCISPQRLLYLLSPSLDVIAQAHPIY
jgi:Aconitase family (aconitate hydratase)